MKCLCSRVAFFVLELPSFELPCTPLCSVETEWNWLTMGQLHGKHHSSRVDPTWLLWRRWLVDVSQRSNEKRIEKTCSLNQSTCRSHQHSSMRAVRIFLFNSLSHCKVHYRFDREGAVSWLHQIPPEGLFNATSVSAGCLCWSVRCNKDLFHCCQRLFGVCAANRWRAAGWRTKHPET